MRLPLSAAQVATHHFDEMIAVSGRPFSDGLTFEVIVEVFIWIQFRAVARQEEEFDLILVLRCP